VVNPNSTIAATRLEHAFSARGKVMVVRVLYALDSRLCPAWVRACDARVLGCAFSWQMISARAKICWLACAYQARLQLDARKLTQHQAENVCPMFDNTKPNLAIIIDRDVVMHHKI
jgi:hypothetical protein